MPAGASRAPIMLDFLKDTLRPSNISCVLALLTPDAGLRVLEAARLFELLNSPLVIASGGVIEDDRAAAPESVALQRALIDLGVRPDRIVLESDSKNTRDEVILVKRMLAERGATDF